MRIEKLTIEIEDNDKPDGGDVIVHIQGKVLSKIYQDDMSSWSNIKGAIHNLIVEMGPIGPGRKVTIRSEP